MNARRFTAGLLACLTLFGLSACGGDSEQAAETAQVEEQGTAVETRTVERTDLANENMVSGHRGLCGVHRPHHRRHRAEPAGQGG